MDIKTAIGMVEGTHLDQLLHPQFKNVDAYAADVLGTGLPASPGAAVGQVRPPRRATRAPLLPIRSSLRAPPVVEERPRRLRGTETEAKTNQGGDEL